MKQRIMWLSAAAVAALTGVSSPASAQAPMAEADAPTGRVSNQYICRFDASVSPAQVRAEAARAAGPTGQVLYTYRSTIIGFAVRMPAQPGARSHVAEIRANNPKVRGCNQDQYVKALVQPGASARPGSGSTVQKQDWGVTRVGGPGTPVTGRVAWIIDTGIDLDHPDLNISAADERHRNFITRDDSPDDLNGHGTHVAGTIGAKDNTVGARGIAPSATVIAVRVLDRRGSGTWSGVIAGVDYVGRNGNGGDVANMSLGGGASNDVDDAVRCAANGPTAQLVSDYQCSSESEGGIKFTIAAGNDGAHAMNYSPARAGKDAGDNIYTVSAFGQTNDTLASWSNWGNPPIEYAEPGVSIYSTYKDGTYKTLSGTSMAAPHLAGILMTNDRDTQGNVNTDGTVNGDTEEGDAGDPDVIGVRVVPAE